MYFFKEFDEVTSSFSCFMNAGEFREHYALSGKEEVFVMKAKKVLALLLILTMALAVLAACGKKTVTEEEPVTTPVDDGETEEPTEPDGEPEEPVDDTPGSTPREETLYFNGQQWGAVNAWNPLHSNNNNFCMANGASARVIVYETMFVYNLLDGKLYPLLGKEYSFNEDQTELTVKLNPDATWSDGTPVTAEDVEYSWEVHKKYESPQYNGNVDYIADVVAEDELTVVIKAVLDEEGRAKNPLQLQAYIAQQYIMQRSYLQKVEERNEFDAAAIKEDTMDDFVASGPYMKYYDDDQKLVYVRNENYWGQSDSMWGKLPAPKYLAHTMFADNAAGNLAFANGEVDMSQQFNLDIANMMANSDTISTYVDEAPYNVCVSMPTAWFNLDVPGLDRKEVRKAIAMAVDYDQIVTAAMGGQCPSFAEVPRSVMNPTEGEQAMIDKEALKPYQWVGKDIAGANALLDEAGIVDTNGDGIREIDGENLHFQAACPQGWNDWEASMEILAAAGKEIGIEIETYFPEASTFYDMFTNHNFEIGMWSSVGAGITSPWSRVRGLMSSEFVGLSANWSGNYGWYENERADELIRLIPHETDAEKLKEYYTELSIIYLEDVPSFSLMYRPEVFHNTNEVVWTGFPAQGDGRNIPPTDCTDGYGIAALYDLQLVE